MAVTMTGSTRRESTDTDITRPLMTALYTHTHTCVLLVQTHSDEVIQDQS